MARKQFLLLILGVAFCLKLFYNLTKSSSSVISTPEKRAVLLPQAVLRRLLQQQHDFLPVTDEILWSTGQRKTNYDGSGKVVGLPDRQVQFSIHNSTSLWLDLNRVDHQGVDDQNFTCYRKQNSVLSIPVEKERLTMSILVSVGNSTQLFQKTGSEILLVSRSLRADLEYNVTITLLQSGRVRDSALTLSGIWLSKGGLINNDRTSQGRRWSFLNLEASQYESLNGCRISQDTAHIIEIVASSNTLSLNVSAPSPHGSTKGVTYSDLLEQSKLFKATTSTRALDDCIHPKCQIEKQAKSLPTVPSTHFNSKPSTKPRSHPKAYIFSLGLVDFHHLFTTTHPLSQPTLASFSSAFTTAYVNLILTFRRTRWHTTTPNQDKTHAYNSAPSKTPIFIMVPPLPSSNKYKHNPLLSTALHNALNSMITHLREEGDPSSVLIDTTGWLDDTDFMAPTNTSTTPPPDSTLYSVELPIPNASGHRKISHLLELHLCAYLADNPSLCPFERGHDPYVGNLYVPDEVAVGRAIEEAKIQRVKMMLGGFT